MSHAPLVARCPAKINLSLRVLGRREDGYHDLDTVFQAIDLWDELEIHPASELTLECDHLNVPTDSSNLVLRAAELLRARHEAGADGARIVLRKSIPPAAGLGGGSSNAAGALLLCSRFWELPVGEAELCALGGELGADVPFFFHGGRARGLGRGDRLTPLAFPGESHLLLGLPPFGLSTAEVFRRHAERLTPPANGVSLARPIGHKWPEGNNFSLAANDLESVVFDGWPELSSFRDALVEQGAEPALLSGSGSTVYGVFEGAADVDRVRDALGARFGHWTLLPSRTVPGSVRVNPLGRRGA